MSQVKTKYIVERHPQTGKPWVYENKFLAFVSAKEFALKQVGEEVTRCLLAGNDNLVVIADKAVDAFTVFIPEKKASHKPCPFVGFKIIKQES